MRIIEDTFTVDPPPTARDVDYQDLPTGLLILLAKSGDQGAVDHLCRQLTASGDWDPAQHPRGEHGKFIETGDDTPPTREERAQAAEEAAAVHHSDGTLYSPTEASVAATIRQAWDQTHPNNPHYLATTGGATVDLRDMDPPLAREVADRIAAFGQEFPSALAQLGEVRARAFAAGDDPSAFAFTGRNRDTGYTAIVLNSLWYRSASALKTVTERLAQTDDHPEPTTRSIIDHELGHLLDRSLFDVARNDFPSAGLVWVGEQEMATISHYARDGGPKEGFAEAFAVRQAEGINGLKDQTVRAALGEAIRRAGGHATLAVTAAATAAGLDDITCHGYIPDRYESRSRREHRR